MFAMGIPLLPGRTFSEYDSKEAPRVAIINEMMGRRCFPDENPIGKRIQLTSGPEIFREIVGIVGDAKHYGLNSETNHELFPKNWTQDNEKSRSKNARGPQETRI